MQTFSTLLLAAAGLASANDYSHDGNYGAPYPDTTYPGFESEHPLTIEGSKSFQTSPPKYPSPCEWRASPHRPWGCVPMLQPVRKLISCDRGRRIWRMGHRLRESACLRQPAHARREGQPDHRHRLGARAMRRPDGLYPASWLPRPLPTRQPSWCPQYRLQQCVPGWRQRRCHLGPELGLPPRTCHGRGACWQGI